MLTINIYKNHNVFGFHAYCNASVQHIINTEQAVNYLKVTLRHFLKPHTHKEQNLASAHAKFMDAEKKYF